MGMGTALAESDQVASLTAQVRALEEALATAQRCRQFENAEHIAEIERLSRKLERHERVRGGVVERRD